MTGTFFGQRSLNKNVPVTFFFPPFLAKMVFMTFNLVLIFSLLLSSCVLAQELPRSMKTAGFWIGRHPSADAVIMTPQAIDQFNAGLRRDKKLTKDIFTLIQDLKTENLLEDLERTVSDIASKGYYTAKGIKTDEDYMDEIRNNMDLGGVITGMAPRYGLVTHFAPQRFLPVTEGLYAQIGDFAFDQLQNSALDVGTPVAVVHTSADGLWYYVMTDISDGWVEAKNIALGDFNQVKEFAQDKDFVVVIRPKADIFLNGPMTNDDDIVRMGVRLPLVSVDAGHATVKVPVMGPDGSLGLRQAFMDTGDVHTGFLEFTPRHIYQQALAMLNQPYGWGDMHGEQDCSRFLQMVFATVGIVLPRDSKDQAQVSNSAVDFDENSDDASKIAAMIKAPAAYTFLVLKGHIMLYLGTVDGQPYVIHETTSYKQKIAKKEVSYDFNRVIISDLSLGQVSKKGSLLKRVTRIVSIE